MDTPKEQTYFELLYITYNKLCVVADGDSSVVGEKHLSKDELEDLIKAVEKMLSGKLSYYKLGYLSFYREMLSYTVTNTITITEIVTPQTYRSFLSDLYTSRKEMVDTLAQYSHSLVSLDSESLFNAMQHKFQLPIKETISCPEEFLVEADRASKILLKAPES